MRQNVIATSEHFKNYFKTSDVNTPRTMVSITGPVINPTLPASDVPPTSRLHEVIKNHLPTPTTSIWACYKEMIPAWIRQFKGEGLFPCARTAPHGKTIPIRAARPIGD